MASLPSGVVAVVDEAYIEFVQDRNCLYSIGELSESRPVITLRTFSKAYGLAGLRIGYGVMPAAMADLLNRVRQPFNTNSLAQVGAAAALDDTAFLEKTVKLVHQELDYLYGALDQMAVSYFPTQTNFFLIDVRKDANQIFEGMLRQGVIVRSMSSYGYPHFIRINVGLHEENVRFIRALKAVL
jgi:histidinol-phosphate aminotransferase